MFIFYERCCHTSLQKGCINWHPCQWRLPACLQVSSHTSRPGSLASSFLHPCSLNETLIKTTNNAFGKDPGTPNPFVFSKRNQTFEALTGLQLPRHSPGINSKNTNKTHLLFPNNLQSSSMGPTWGPAALLSIRYKKDFQRQLVFSWVETRARICI